MLIRAVPVLVALPGRPPLPNKALELETLPQGPLLGKPKLRRGAEACFWSVFTFRAVMRMCQHVVRMCMFFRSWRRFARQKNGMNPCQGFYRARRQGCGPLIDDPQ